MTENDDDDDDLGLATVADAFVTGDVSPAALLDAAIGIPVADLLTVIQDATTRRLADGGGSACVMTVTAVDADDAARICSGVPYSAAGLTIRDRGCSRMMPGAAFAIWLCDAGGVLVRAGESGSWLKLTMGE